MDRKIQKLLALNKMYPKADVNKIYVPKREEGIGMINLEICIQTTTIGLNSGVTRGLDFICSFIIFFIFSVF